MKPEEFGEHITIARRNHLLRHEEDDVDEEEIAGDGRDIFEHKRGVSAVLKLGQGIMASLSDEMRLMCSFVHLIYDRILWIFKVYQ